MALAAEHDSGAMPASSSISFVSCARRPQAVWLLPGEPRDFAHLINCADGYMLSRSVPSVDAATLLSLSLSPKQ